MRDESIEAHDTAAFARRVVVVTVFQMAFAIALIVLIF
jgi:hypothetical protein